MLVRLCRFYQRLFPTAGHAEEGWLVALHRPETMDQFHAEYIRSEMAKGERSLAQFGPFAEGLKGATVLDFGCGGGGITFRLGECASEAWGVDVDAEKLEFARREAERISRSNVHFSLYDGERLPFEDARFDFVYCVDVVEHLSDPTGSLAEIARVLRPGGKLLLSFGPPWRHAHGKHMWTKLPGWWTHLIFPRSVVMEVRGLSPKTTWEEIGIHRLTVAKFERVTLFLRTWLEPLHIKYRSNRLVAPMRRIPWLREFFIAEVVAVYRKTAHHARGSSTVLSTAARS
jgi:SAM-dependent methyltransferase